MAKQRLTKDYEKAVKKYDEQHSGAVRDPRFFKPQADKNGRGTITLRFLPSPDTDTDFIKADEHTFNTRTGAFFSENCPKNIGEECPICEYAWGNWIKDDKKHNERFKNYTPKQKFIMNIVVLKDKETPTNEGKVFLWKFGNQIMKKIREQTSNGVYPWDWEEGLDFKLKIEQKVVDGKAMPNYDSSYFDDDDVSPLELDIGNEDLFSLTEFQDEKLFKSASDISIRFEKATGIDPTDIPVKGSKDSRKDDRDDDDDDKKDEKEEVKEERAPRKDRTSAKTNLTKTAKVTEEDLDPAKHKEDLPFDGGAADEDSFVIEEETSESFFDTVDTE